jgi:Cofactor assembly of complex C subunit B
VTDSSLLSSLVLTLLMLVGLIFFLKSSTKDRTTEMIFAHPSWGEEQLLRETIAYLLGRAYKVMRVDAEREAITLEGQVSPSVALMVLLMLMAGIGLSCISLVLATLLPDLGDLVWLSLLSVPGVGVFYWRGASRKEQVNLEMRSPARLWVKAHKDEITEMQQALGLQRE